MTMHLELPPATGTEERLFTLPCGCVAVTREDQPFEVRWCPHHRMLHGVIPCDFAHDARSEKRAPRADILR
jgi:hypothetical protein